MVLSLPLSRFYFLKAGLFSHIDVVDDPDVPEQLVDFFQRFTCGTLGINV